MRCEVRFGTELLHAAGLPHEAAGMPGAEGHNNLLASR